VPLNVCKSQTNVGYMIAAVTGATSYSWSATNNPTFTSVSGVNATLDFTTSTATSATISVAAANACGTGQPAKLTVSINTGCRDQNVTGISSMLSSSLSPNPTHGQFKLEYRLESDEHFNIAILNLLGETIQQREVKSVRGNNTLDMDLSDYPAGVYFVRMRTATGIENVLRIVHE